MPAGRIVAVTTRFRQLLPPSDALFGTTALFVATGIPSHFFRGGEVDAVVALRTTGTRAVVVDGGERRVPVGAYVGDYMCAEPGCADFWRE